jgi:glutamate--cysteine ligase
MRLIDLFLIACLIDDSPPCEAHGQRQNKTNLQRMVNRGREPGLTLLSRDGVETPREVLAQPILDRMDEVAKWYDSGTGSTDYEQVVTRARTHIADPALTLSARILDEMTTNNQSFWQLALRYSREWHQQHLATSLTDATWTAMIDDAAASLERQREIESHDNQSFDTYLSQFYEAVSVGLTVTPAREVKAGLAPIPHRLR